MTGVLTIPQRRCLRVKITDAYLIAGLRGDCSHCPLALRIFDWLAPGWDVTVSSSLIVISSPGLGLFNIQTPLVARQFIRRFDAKDETGPLRFSLDVSAVPPEAFMPNAPVGSAPRRPIP